MSAPREAVTGEDQAVEPPVQAPSAASTPVPVALPASDAETHRIGEDPHPWVARASWALPWAFAVLCAGEGMGMLDAPALAAAGGGLGVTHPPGHPLFVALGACASLFPLGPLPFRMALVEGALLGAAGRIALSLALRVTLAVAPGVTLRARSLCALAAALCAVLGAGVFRQATRVEVYALALALAALPALLAVPRVDRDGLATRMGETPAEDDPAVFVRARRLRTAALFAGFGLANHHFIQLTALPLVLWAWVSHVRSLRSAPGFAWWRSPAAYAALALPAALLPYALLPLRAHAPASIARPSTLGDVLDVASARIYAKNTGTSVPGSALTRVGEVLDALSSSLMPIGLVGALAGLYLLARVRRTRPLALRLALLAVPAMAARAFLGFTRDNPDAWGYLAPAVLALATAFAAFPAGVLQALRDAPAAPEGPSRGARALLFVLLVLGPCALPVYLAFDARRASAIDRASTPEVLVNATFDALPPRGIFFAYDPPTVFRLRYAQVVEGERPDVIVVPVPLLGYPGVVPAMLARDAALGTAMTQHLLRPDREIPARVLSALSSQRQIFVEPDPRSALAYTSVLLPRGAAFQVMSEPTTLASVRGAAAAHFARLDALGARLNDDPAGARAASDGLLWRAYSEALFFAARGARPESRRSLQRALALAPESRELIALRDALGGPGEGPIDVRGFLPGGSVPALER